MSTAIECNYYAGHYYIDAANPYYQLGTCATDSPLVSVTVPSSGNVLVIVTAQVVTHDDGMAWVSFTSGGGTGDVSASDARALIAMVGGTNGTYMSIQASAMFYVTGLSAGSHTFALCYTSDGGGITFRYRGITVIPMP